MVDAIQPVQPVQRIQPIGMGQHITEIYPHFTVLRVRPFLRPPGKPPEEPLSGTETYESAMAKLPSVEEDAESLRRSAEDYYAAQHNILMRARLAFFYGRFDEAERYYTTYINYHDTFGHGYDESLQEYFPALFEFCWLMYLCKRKETGDRFLHAEFADFLDRMVRSRNTDTQEGHAVYRYVSRAWQEGRLPSKTDYRRRFPNRQFIRLARFLVKNGFSADAEFVLAFVKVKQLMKLFQTDLIIERLPGSEHAMGGFSLSQLPVFYNFEGLSRLSEDG